MEKINLNEIDVNGVVYIKKDSIKLPAPEYKGDVKIVILSQGWVYIGRLEKVEKGYKLHSAYNIRRWGTSKGLGELIEGKLSDTKLDYYGLIEFDEYINTISVNPDKWEEIE